jgi:hypothetical protein
MYIQDTFDKFNEYVPYSILPTQYLNKFVHFLCNEVLDIPFIFCPCCILNLLPILAVRLIITVARCSPTKTCYWLLLVLLTPRAN